MPERPDVRLDLIPTEPGVYLMKDKSGSVIYVGKAGNLRNRLTYYFSPAPEGDAKVLAMISRIASFDYIVTANELEAFILEANLIKENKPHYNILLRDDKEYPYICVTWQDMYPRVMKTFHIGRDVRQGALYYGPYLSGDLYHALKTIHDIFPLKTCKRVFPRDIGKERPCLNYYIGRCIAPCKGDVPSSAYRAVIADVCRFLEGRYDGLLGELKAKMTEASDDLRFEEAARWRDRLVALERLLKAQHVVAADKVDRDVIGIASNEAESCLIKVEVREGRAIRIVPFFFEKGEDLPAIIKAFLSQHYPDMPFVPAEILVPLDLTDADAAEASLTAMKGARVKIIHPKRGERVSILQFANENAKQNLLRHTLMGGAGQSRLDETLKQLAELVGLTGGLERIEAYDVSHLGGADRSASLVVFSGGKPERQAYRHFKLHEGDARDDYEAMREVLTRRLKRLDDKSFGQVPDLILVDGGRGQVSAVQPLVKDLGIALAGIVKDRRHRTRGLVTADGIVHELSVTEGDSDRAKKIALWRLLTAIQDEAHRFAGRLRKKQENKRQTRWTLESIPGVGPARRKKLMQAFGTMAAIEAASVDQLLEKGIDRRTAEAVHRHYHEEKT
ncbi:MAG TPA: excinuclease ABC subunit UvrC [Clostridiaceae bacterium]|nr:excinuclease ABC subunit UvrC [Clostridiaceae bacterium]